MHLARYLHHTKRMSREVKTDDRPNFHDLRQQGKSVPEAIYTRNADTALRMLQATVYGNPEHEFARNPQDYELFQLGEYSDQDGSMNCYPPAHVLNLVELKWEDPPTTKVPNNATSGKEAIN